MFNKSFDILKTYSTHIVYYMFLLTFNSINSQDLKSIQDLRDRYENLQEGYNPIDESKIEEDLASPSRVLMIPPELKDDSPFSIDNSLKHFGYDFFVKRDTISFMENFSVPSDYVLGPGDELIISIWGETQIRNNYVITRDGKIYDERVGLLFLSGKKISEARDYLKLQFGKVYSTLVGDNPSSYLDLTLGELNSINVNFVGNVEYPGVYPLHPFSSLIEGLVHAGGIDTSGTLRNIEIKRFNKKSINVDLYDFLIKGYSPDSLILKDQDIVVIKSRKSKVIIDSSVVNPHL